MGNAIHLHILVPSVLVVLAGLYFIEKNTKGTLRMTESETKPSRIRRLVDATIITTVSTAVASIVAGVALVVYQQVDSANRALSAQQVILESLQRDVIKTQELLTEELAPLKAHLRQLDSDHTVTIDEIREHEDLLEDKFKDEARNAQQQQQSIP